MDPKPSCRGALARGVVGRAQVIAFGTSIVAPAASVPTLLVILAAYAGYASPFVVLVAFLASLCCALSVSELVRRLPAAGWAYTYNSRWLGPSAGFLTGWMMVFTYALFIPGGIALTSVYTSRLIDDTLHVTVQPWLLFVVVLVAVAVVTYAGIAVSSWLDLALVAGEMAVIAALAVTILVKLDRSRYTLAVFSPTNVPRADLTDLTNAVIFGLAAFAGFEAAASLGEEARDARRSVPTGIIGTVVVTGVFYLLVVLAETFALGRDGIPGFAQSGSPLGDLTATYWSPSALWVIDLAITLTGLGFVIAVANAAIRVVFAMGREGVLPASVSRLSSRRSPVVALGCVVAVALALGLPLTYGIGGARTFGYLAAAGSLSIVLVYLMVNFAVMRAFRTEFRDEFRLWRHALVPAAATVVFLVSLWGLVHPGAYTLQSLLPFVSLAWLCVGVVVVAVLRTRRAGRFSMQGQVQGPDVRDDAARLAEPELPEIA